MSSIPRGCNDAEFTLSHPITDEDSFGRALWSCYRSKATDHIIEREDGHVICGSTPFYFTDYSTWPACEKRALRFVRGRILDVGCGAGRVTLYLQRKGFDVAGIDSSRSAIRVCRKRGVKHALVGAIEDLPQFLINPVDTILLLGGGFGLLGDEHRARCVFRALSSITSAKAVVIASSRTPYFDDGLIDAEYRRRNRAEGRMPGQLRLRVRFRRYASPWFNFLLVSRREMKSILAGTSWEVRKFLTGEGEYFGILGKR